MDSLNDIFNKFKKDSEDRYNNFVIGSINSISTISDEAYLEKPTWLGGDEKFVCLFIDLDNSTEISQMKQRSTMAKIYDYFTQNIYDILTIPEITADYIDIKGDGLFGIYEGDYAIFKAFVAAQTFKTFFEKNIKDRFKDSKIILRCKIAINKDKILVKKIGGRGDYNEVWAGELVNNTFKIASLNKKIYEQNPKNFDARDLIIISEDIYKKLLEKENYAILSCGHTNGKRTGKTKLWKEFTDMSKDNQYNGIVYYTESQWCDECGDKYLNEILK